MKRIKLILVCGVVLAFAGVATMVVAAGAQRSAKAIVRSVHGDVTYQMDGVGPFLPLKPNMELTEKTVLKSGPDADAYLTINGLTSSVKLGEKTTVTLAKMVAMGTDTTTDLKLDGGSLLGNVRKLSANSDYRVSVPNGTAGIRGTDFQVTVTYEGNGNFTVVFTSVTGTLVCQVSLPPGQTTGGTRTLNTGESWTVTGNAQGTTLTINQTQTLPAAALAALIQAAGQLPIITTPTTPTPPSPPVYTPPSTPPSTEGGNSGGNPSTMGP